MLALRFFDDWYRDVCIAVRQLTPTMYSSAICQDIGVLDGTESYFNLGLLQPK